MTIGRPTKQTHPVTSGFRPHSYVAIVVQPHLRLICVKTSDTVRRARRRAAASGARMCMQSSPSLLAERSTRTWPSSEPFDSGRVRSSSDGQLPGRDSRPGELVRHGVAAELPSPHHAEAGQILQAVLPSSPWNVPGRQRLHMPMPVSLAKLPTPHGLGEAPPPRHQVPTGHGSQSL